MGAADSPARNGRTGSPQHGHSKDGGAIMVVARGIYRLRCVFVVSWIAASVVLAPFAFKLLGRAAPMAKKPPGGTESSAAMDMFESHYNNLAILRREMISFKCKNRCPSKTGTADTVMSKGFVEQLVDMVKRFNTTHPGSIVQIHSYYAFHGHHQLGENPMISQDGRSILMQWIWRVPPPMKAASEKFCEEVQKKIAEQNAYQGDDGMEVAATGLVFLDHAMKETLIEEIPVHEVCTIWLPFSILAFALGDARMLILACLAMPVEIIVAFGIMYFVSLQTTVVLFALMMMLMLCTSLSFDYSLFTLTRYAEERATGATVEEAILTVISQSGRVVVVSGCVLMISWGAMLGLPSPFNGFCVSANAMIFVCVLVQLTFVPSLLAMFPFLGPPAAEKPSAALGTFDDSLESASRPLKHVSGDGVNGTQAAPMDEALIRAAPHRQGMFYWSGAWITKFPLNVLLPLAIYWMMYPLTNRMSHNFDFSEFKFKMGHSYELTMPRTSHEWHTILEIQKEFPSEAGILMPMMIMMTSTDSTGKPLDVSNQGAFDVNCQMIDSIIAATRGAPYALTADNFVSATMHGEEEDGTVKCLKSWQIDLVRNNYLVKNVFLSHTSEHLQELWAQLVSPNGHAMLTFLFPTMDPFSPQAFDLVKDVRSALEMQTRTKPGVSFLTFSPGSVLMDLIDVTSGQLPLCFIVCASVCLTLIAFWFKSALIPFKLLLTVVVPLTWTYGAGLYVYEDCMLDWTGVPGLMCTGDAGLDWTVPMFTLTFMMGLALDYEIFLFERVLEFREEGFGDCESIQLGLAATGGTISSAGLIMALTFLAQLLGSIPVTNQMGFILVFSIVVDTFIVRSILVPAVLSLVPCSNYWPTKMPPAKYLWLNDEDVEDDDDFEETDE